MVLTASLRLARELRQAFTQLKLADGVMAWPTPAIYSLHDWVFRQFEDSDAALTSARVLDTVAATALWESCIENYAPDDMYGSALLVKQARQTWQRMQEWQVSLSEVTNAARHADERLFASALSDYSKRLEDERWVDSGGQLHCVIEMLKAEDVTVPGCLTLAGFDRINPALQTLLHALKAQGCNVRFVPPDAQSSPLLMTSLPSAEAEWRAAGAWARSIVADQPDARVAIVVPDLQKNAAEIADNVRDGFLPGWQFNWARCLDAVDVSYGRPLADYPMITVALLLLRWVSDGLDTRHLSILLRSRCLSEPDDGTGSALDIALRRYPDRVWLPADFADLFLIDAELATHTRLIGAIGTMQAFSHSQNVRREPSEWVSAIDEFLTSVGWPGSESLSSEEFQLMNRWRQLLNEYSRIDAVVPRVDLATSLKHLGRLARETIYQAESGGSGLQVMGVLEAAGLEFDHVWICGLDSTRWPLAASPAQLLGFDLQRRYAMPDATPEDTLEFSRKILGRLVGSAPECRGSWAEKEGDLGLAATAMLDSLEWRTADAPPPYTRFLETLVGPDQIEDCEPDDGPPVGENERVRGGAYTIQLQHGEPFAAFVQGRLGVRPLDPISAGLAPAARGSIIHWALHNLLASHPEQQELILWDDTVLTSKLGSAIDAALARYHQFADARLSQILVLERRRLMTLLDAFIKFEKEREPFAVVATEQQQSLKHLGLDMTVRVDRIDRIAGNGMLVIDYKTGTAKGLFNREGELKDLQLVVYAAALEGEGGVGGLALMNIDSREISLKGSGAGGHWKEPFDANWPEQLELWKGIVCDAIAGIIAGDLRINMRMSTTESRPLNLLARKEELRRG